MGYTELKVQRSGDDFVLVCAYTKKGIISMVVTHIILIPIIVWCCYQIENIYFIYLGAFIIIYLCLNFLLDRESIAVLKDEKIKFFCNKKAKSKLNFKIHSIFYVFPILSIFSKKRSTFPTKDILKLAVYKDPDRAYGVNIFMKDGDVYFCSGAGYLPTPIIFRFSNESEMIKAVQIMATYAKVPAYDVKGNELNTISLDEINDQEIN